MFTEVGGKVVCLLCREQISLNQHNETKYKKSQIQERKQHDQLCNIPKIHKHPGSSLTDDQLRFASPPQTFRLTLTLLLKASRD